MVKALADILYKLPDSEYGADTMPDGFAPSCGKCGRRIEIKKQVTSRYGRFVHDCCLDKEEGGTDN